MGLTVILGPILDSAVQLVGGHIFLYWPQYYTDVNKCMVVVTYFISSISRII